MIDREKTIRDLETIGAWHTHHYEPFHYECAETIHNALELLKEQEARKPDCEHAEHDGAGCLGYAGCSQDDEPIETCKVCDAYTGNRTERR